MEPGLRRIEKQDWGSSLDPNCLDFDLKLLTSIYYHPSVIIHLLLVSNIVYYRYPKGTHVLTIDYFE